MNRKEKKLEENQLEKNQETKLVNLEPQDFQAPLDENFEDAIPVPNEYQDTLSPQIDFLQNLNDGIKEMKKNRWIEVECIIVNDTGFNFADYWFDSNDVQAVGTVNEVDFDNAGITDLNEYDIDPENCCQIFFRNREKPLIVMDFTPSEILEKLQ